MIQIDRPQRHVYIKFRDPQRTQEILTATQGQEDFRHKNGEISKVRIEAVEIGMRRVTVASLTPQVEDKTLKMAMGAFGEIVIFNGKYGQMPITIGFPMGYVW
jgi:hypothetical protein